MSARRCLATRVVAASAVLISAVGSARGGDGDKNTPDEHGFLPVKAEPPSDDYTHEGRYGGTIAWAELGEIDRFHPLMTNSATSQELSQLVFDTLTSYDNEKWADRPSLAWKWERSDDNLTWTFHLRKGVRWSDGAPFNADDVLFTYETVYNPKFPNSDVDGLKVGDAPLPRIEAPDPYTVVFHCSTVNALFLTNLSNTRIVPKHVWKDAAAGENPSYATVMGCDKPESVVGTGPFQVVEYVSGEKVVYRRNPYSWRTNTKGQRLPFADGLVVKLVANNNTRSLQFLNGDLDLINDIQVTDYKQFKEKEAEGWFTLHRPGLSLNTTWVCLNEHPGKDPQTGDAFVAPYKLKWFQDRRFRRALSHATNRENMVKLILDGKGEPIYSETTRANKVWYADVTKFPYDLARANSLLDEIGLDKRDADGIRMDAGGHRVSIDLVTNVENDVRVKVIAQLRSDWAKAGVEAVTRPIAFNELSAQLDDIHKWEAILLGWASGVPPDPLNGKNIILSSGRLHAWYPKQEKPFAEWEARADAIIAQMDVEPDTAKRRPLWAEFLEVEAQEQANIYLYAANTYAASKKRVMNMRASLLRPSTWWNIEELWIEDKK